MASVYAFASFSLLRRCGQSPLTAPNARADMNLPADRAACDPARNQDGGFYVAVESANAYAGDCADDCDAPTVPLCASQEKLLFFPVRNRPDASSRRSASGGGVRMLPRQYSRRSLVAPECLCLWKATADNDGISMQCVRTEV